MVLNPTESSSGIPQSSFGEGSATKQKREQSSFPQLSDAKVKGKGSCLLKAEGWGFILSVAKGHIGLTSIWLLAHSTRNNLDTGRFSGLAKFEGGVCAESRPGGGCLRVPEQEQEGDQTLVHTDRAATGGVPPCTSQISPSLCRYKPLLRVS